MKTSLFHIAMLWLMLLTLISCEHKELCYDHPHKQNLSIRFDWSEAPNASPAGMCVYFYPINDEGTMQRFDFSGTVGGDIELTAGHYRVLCYNNDTKAVLFDGVSDFFTHKGYTRASNVLEPIYGNSASYSQQASNTTDECVVLCPDMMWGCSITDVEVLDLTHNGTNDGTTQTITLHPHETVCTYTYEIRNVKNLEHVALMSASLSGMSGELAFGTEVMGEECVTLPFEAKAVGGSTIMGTFYTFGHNELNLTAHRLTLYIIMDDGSKYVYGTTGQRFNVTNQIHTAADRHHVYIVIDGLDLPQPMTDNGGMVPSVDDWQEINTDIYI